MFSSFILIRNLQYSSDSFSYSFISSSSFSWVSTSSMVFKSILIAFFSSKNSFNYSILLSSKLYPHAMYKLNLMIDEWYQWEAWGAQISLHIPGVTYRRTRNSIYRVPFLAWSTQFYYYPCPIPTRSSPPRLLIQSFRLIN